MTPGSIENFSNTADCSRSRRCWVCGGSGLNRIRESTLPSRLSSENFRITDLDYGRSAAIYRCTDCGFHQCNDMVDVLKFYEEISDQDYETTRVQRAIQERAVLKQLVRQRNASGLRLLDVGAGSGILVEQALKMGFDAVGVEPSHSLQMQAVRLQLPVYQGVLPHPEIGGLFDIITLIDVIEHVNNPVEILQTVKELLAPDGVLVVVTPDRSSVAAQLMQRRWWHYRIAHIGYFDLHSLDRALTAAGLIRKTFRRPTWYFPFNYIFDRAVSYLPDRLRMRAPLWMRHITVPVNLRDSMEVVAVRNSTN